MRGGCLRGRVEEDTHTHKYTHTHTDDCLFVCQTTPHFTAPPPPPPADCAINQSNFLFAFLLFMFADAQVWMHMQNITHLQQFLQLFRQTNSQTTCYIIRNWMCRLVDESVICFITASRFKLWKKVLYIAKKCAYFPQNKWNICW